jgi:hypothetical protein
VKIIAETIIPLLLIITLTACGSVAVPSPTAKLVDVMETAIAIAGTEVFMTQVAIPTATYLPTVTWIPPTTATPPKPTRIPLDAYADKIDYAMATAPKIYIHLPYINKETPYGEYSGCITTYDFHNFVGYRVLLPMETVTTAYLNYFSTGKWEFTEATSELVGYGKNVPRTTFDVYRIQRQASI